MFLIMFLAACGSTAPPPPPPPTPPPTCPVQGLETAHSVVRVSLPTTCDFFDSGPLYAPLHVEDPAAAVSCLSGSPSVIDLSAQDLYVVGYELPPASASLKILDDGATVTFVTRLRSPCPDHPRQTLRTEVEGFWLPKGASRVWREASCTSLPTPCD